MEVECLRLFQVVQSNYLLPQFRFYQARCHLAILSVAAVYEEPKSASFFGIGDANGDGLNDIILNDGPSALLQRATAPGIFDGVRTLR